MEFPSTKQLMTWTRRANGVRFMAAQSVMTFAVHYPLPIDLSIHLHYIDCMKTATVQIRLDPAEKLAFEQAARLSGIALSAWMRERLRRAARAELVDSGRQVPFIERGAKQ